MTSPEEILAFAEILHKTNYNNLKSIEVVKRTVIGRAYYATYHKALNSPEAELFEKPTKDCHKKLIEFYNEHGVDNKIIAKKLANLRRLRNMADYNLSAEIKLTEIKNAISDAKEIFKLLQ